MKTRVLFLSIIVASCLLGVSIYNSIIDAKSWGADIPTSIQTARDYYKYVDPRNFYVIFGPANMILVLFALVLFWKDPKKLRIYFAFSFLFYTGIILITFLYFIPRDLILFTKPISGNTELIKNAASEWSRMNWFRSALGLAGVICSFKALDIYYKSRKRY